MCACVVCALGVVAKYPSRHVHTHTHSSPSHSYGRNVSAQYWADTLRKEMARAVWMAQALGAPHTPLGNAEALAHTLHSGREVVTQVGR